MYDDDDDDDVNEDRDKYAIECSSVDSMAQKVREYLLDEAEIGVQLSEGDVDTALALPEAQDIIRRCVDMRSYVYYAGERVRELMAST